MRKHTAHFSAVSSSEAMKGACCPTAVLLDWLSPESLSLLLLLLLLLLLPASLCFAAFSDAPAASNGSTSGT
jgi:hypothetical protein